MAIDNLKLGQIVDILYNTYNNCTPKSRRLTNLKVIEILPNSVKFVQLTNKPRNYWINNSEIISIFHIQNPCPVGDKTDISKEVV